MVEEHRDWKSPHDYNGPPSKQFMCLLDLPMHINDYLQEWISEIQTQIAKISPIKSMNLLLHEKPARFLNFNYTTTPETVYNIQAACHIHGRIGEKLLMGHSEISGKIYGNDFGINLVNQKFLEQYFKNSYKDCQKMMKRFPQIFKKENLAAITEVYVLGHSLNNVDMPYIRKIKRNLSKDTRWFIAVLPNGQDYYTHIMKHIPIAQDKIHFFPWPI